MYLTLEGKLLLALEAYDHDSVHSLNPEVEKAWRIRTSLRAAIGNRELMQVVQPLLAATELSAAPSKVCVRSPGFNGDDNKMIV